MNQCSARLGPHSIRHVTPWWQVFTAVVSAPTTMIFLVNSIYLTLAMTIAVPCFLVLWNKQKAPQSPTKTL